MTVHAKTDSPNAPRSHRPGLVPRTLPGKAWWAVAALSAGLSCGGRVEPPYEGFAFDAGADDSGGFGGTLPSSASTASPAAPDATLPAAAPAFGADDGGGDDGGDPDAGSSFDGDDGGCTSDLGPGSLFIDEMLIESVDGAGDHGEWLEVANTMPCAVNLRGLHGECPHGAKAATFDLAGDLWIPAGGFFVVADSVSPALDHDVPLPVVAWQGNVGDVLRNKGTTVTLSLGGVLIDTLTYPALALTVGTSLEFPADCDPSTRSDFSRWQPAQSSWFPGFNGTPNAPNTDVACPM